MQGFFQAFIATTVSSFELSFHAKAEGLFPRHKRDQGTKDDRWQMLPPEAQQL